MEINVETNNNGYQQINFGINHSTASFYQIAEKLERVLSIKFKKKYDIFNMLSWDYSYHEVLFKLIYDWHEGICIHLVNKDKSSQHERKIFENLEGILRTNL